MHVLYLTHDLNDAATWRRIAMLRLGGARVTLAGFHRGSVREKDGETPVVALGATRNGRFASRAIAVARARLSLGRLRAIEPPDVILARNLETLALAPRLRRMFPGARATAYECLDIHRLLLGDGLVSRTLRGIERWLLRRTDLILTSSPAFVRHYFLGPQGTGTPIRIVENKCLPGPAAAGEPGRQVTIGWFGVLRCRQSLAVLDALTRAFPGAYRVVMRGRPALDAMPDFLNVVEANPDLVFHGAYAPEDLPAIYGEVHFAWAIDRYEAGANSEWLLPNRLYEGCRHGAVPIALAGTETARFLLARSLGLSLDEASPKALGQALARLTLEDIAGLRAAVRAAPVSLWETSAGECAELVEALGTPRRSVRRAGAVKVLP
jgi:succinoglycan biosynthesis protein ExoL